MRVKNILSVFCGLLVLLLVSCVKGEDATNTKQNNFEQLWRIIDERYCFFDYKQQEIGLDWNAVHDKYAAQLNDKMDNQQFFEVMSNMLAELKDGHVNLGAAHDMARNWSYYVDYPRNYNDSIVQDVYLTPDRKMASGLDYRILDDGIGYVRCASFSNAIGSGNVTLMLQDMLLCRGIIIDVRNNGGGNMNNAHTLASHFINERQLIGYSSHKTGKGHSDFSAPFAEYLDPCNEGVRWQKRCVVLTNRRCFSATNDFVKCMKTSPLVTVMGDSTGGGSGMPMSAELPNGWSVRFSSVVFYDRDMQHTEFGIAPDVPLQMSGKDTDRNLDTYIEEARRYLTNPQ